MKWRSPKFAYPLIIAALAACVLLQFAWLKQLFKAQTTQVKEEITRAMREAQKVSIFNSLDEKNHTPMVREFFHSPQWLEMREAFDGLQMNNVHNVFNYGIDDDSTFVEMRFSFKNTPPPANSIRPKPAAKKPPVKKMEPIETPSLKDMITQVNRRMDSLGIKKYKYYAIYGYDNEKLEKLTLPKDRLHQIVYASNIYSYDLKHHHKFQLLITSLTYPVLYRMKYYIISSLIMLSLTIVAFYFILVLLKKQKFYTDAKISFTNNMTHEFKTPVSTITIALDSITKYNLINNPEKLSYYLEISKLELSRLNLMIERVLSLNVDKSALQSIKPEQLDVLALLKDVILSVKVSADSAGAHISERYADGHCFIKGDPVHVANIFYNLIDNALKYADKPLEIEVCCEPEGNEIVITVQDNGPGIAREYHSKIFDQFFRIPSVGDVHNVKGSGLGLFYVSEIVREHKGNITVKSELNTGTKFTIRLPKA
jgi:signal transduction histidine kinase